MHRKLKHQLAMFLANVCFALCIVGTGHSQDSIHSLIMSVELPVESPAGSGRISEESQGYSVIHNIPSVVTRETWKETLSFDHRAVFDPAADVMWPGALVQGRSLDKGIMEPISLPRTPLTITVTNLQFKGRASDTSSMPASRTVQNPSLATVHDAISTIVAQEVSTNTPAKLSFAIYQVHSVKQALTTLGISSSWLTSDFAAALGVTDMEVRTNFLAKIEQAYYVVAVEPPSAPESYFSDHVSAEDAAVYMGAGNPPGYIASVTYGRVLYLLVSSTEQASKVSSAIRAGMDAGFVVGKGEFTGAKSTVLQESDIRILALGGPASSVVDILSGDKMDALKDYLNEGANYSLESSGVPISYCARFLRDNSLARLSLTTDYDTHSFRAQRITSILVTFNLSTDDKDKEEEIRLTVFDLVGGEKVIVGAGNFGAGTKWKDPGSYPCTVPISTPVPVTDCANLRVRMFKTPHGSPTGCGMQGSINALMTREDGTVSSLFDVGDARYGDNNAYDVEFTSACRY